MFVRANSHVRVRNLAKPCVKRTALTILKMPSPFITYERVRWADVDLVGIMRYSAFTRIIEFADQEMFRAAGLPYDRLMNAPTYWLPRRQLTIDYHAPAHIDELLAVVSYITRLGDTAMTFAFDMRRASRWELVASATMVVVCVTVDTFTKSSLPREMRDGFARFVCSADVGRTWRPTTS